MNDKEKKSIEKIEKKILIGECEKAIGVPIYISDLKIVLNLIENQKEEIEKKDAVIDEMANYIIIHHQVKTMKNTFCKNCTECKGIVRDCIKQYFEKKAKEEK